MLSSYTIKNRNVGWDHRAALSLCPLLNHVDSVAAASSAFAALSETFTLQSVTMPVASATRDVFQWLLVTNFDS